jgi:uncharacterized protein (TIGR03083 family)
MATSASELARAEREELADFLSELSDEQWRSRSLCDRWSVREVAAHTMSFEGLSAGTLASRFARGYLQTDRINQIGVAAMAAHSTDELVDLVRRHAVPQGLGAGFGGRIALTDNMIHQQDIRRPLGLPRVIEPERLLTALDFARWAPLIRGAWRARGVHLVATDVDWSAGNGPEVSGPGEALLMAMAGRADGLHDLDGPGKAVLSGRF